MIARTPTSWNASPRQVSPGVTLVVCTLNEEGNVGPVLGNVPDVVTEILVVDGNSTDGTVKEAEAATDRVRVIAQSGRGKGDALREGFAAARGGIIVQMDADGSMDPYEIPLYVGAIHAGADVVKGSRMAVGAGSTDITLFRRFGNWCFCKTANVLYGSRFTDICYGYMAFRKDVLDALPLGADGFDIEAELALKAFNSGYRVVEIPTFEYERFNGESNLHAFRDGWRILRTILVPPAPAPRRRGASGVPHTDVVVEFEQLPDRLPEGVVVTDGRRVTPNAGLQHHGHGDDKRKHYAQ